MNTTNVDSTRSTAAATRPENRRGTPSEASRAPLPSLPALPAGSDVAPPLETIGSASTMDAIMMDALANGDPSILMAGVAMRLRKSTLESGEVGLRTNSAGAQKHIEAQLAAYQRATEAQRTASNWSTVAKVGAYVAAGLAIVVGVVGALHTGTASLVGGIALACVLVSSVATIGVMAAQDAGAWHGEPPPRWIMITIAAVALLGAVFSLGASSGSAVATIGSLVSIASQTTSIVTDIGTECHWWNEPPPEFKLVLAGLSLAGSMTSIAAGAGGSARQTVDIAGRTVNAIGESVRGTALVAQGVGTIGAAAMNYQADLARIDGDSHRNRRESLRTADEDLVDAIRNAMKGYRRTVRIASDTQEEIRATRTRMTGNFARA